MRRMVFEWKDRIGVTLFENGGLQGKLGGWQQAAWQQAETGRLQPVAAVSLPSRLAAGLMLLCSLGLLPRSPRQRQGGAPRELEEAQGREPALQGPPGGYCTGGVPARLTTRVAAAAAQLFLGTDLALLSASHACPSALCFCRLA